MLGRGLLVAAVALLLAVQVIRNAAVAGLAALRPESAAKLWPGHPDVVFSRGLTEIGRAAREQRTIDAQGFAAIYAASARAPLAPEPYLVRGVQAQLAGDTAAAHRAFLAAQWRDPRSMPAAYFLADFYFRANKPLQGLQQTALLARLSPQGTDTVAPFVAAYAQNRANWPQIRALFRSEEGLEEGVLNALARNAANADAVLALASPEHRRPDSQWLPILLGSLVGAGDYAQARAVWASVGGGKTRPGDLIADADFSNAAAPPPFNWQLTSSTVGLAERQPGNRLHLIFYGNQDGVLASQLLLLPPGNYRMQIQLAGAPSHADALRWSIRCDKATETISSTTLDAVARSGWTFQVPAGCKAQWLELSGRSPDIAQQSDVTISGLSLARVGPHA